MFHVWYNFNIKVTTKTKTNLLIRGIKREFKVVQECFYEHCYLLIFDVLKHIHNLNDLCIMQYKITTAFFLIFETIIFC